MSSLCPVCDLLYEAGTECPRCGEPTEPWGRNLLRRSLQPLSSYRARFFLLILGGLLVFYTFARRPDWETLWMRGATRPPEEVQLLYAMQPVPVRRAPSRTASVAFDLRAGDPAWVGPPGPGGWSALYEPRHGAESAAELDSLGVVYYEPSVLWPQDPEGEEVALRQHFEVAVGYAKRTRLPLGEARCQAAEVEVSLCQLGLADSLSTSACRSAALDLLTHQVEALKKKGVPVREARTHLLCGEQTVAIRAHHRGWVQVEQERAGETLYRKRVRYDLLATEAEGREATR